MTPASVILTVQQLKTVAKWMHSAGCPEISFHLREPPSTEWTMVGESATNLLCCTATLMANRIELPTDFTILKLKRIKKVISKCSGTDVVEFRYDEEEPLASGGRGLPTGHLVTSPRAATLSLTIRHTIQKSYTLINVPVCHKSNARRTYAVDNIKKELIVFRTPLDQSAGRDAWAAIEKCFIKPARKSERISFTIEDGKFQAIWEGGRQQFEIPSILIGEYDHEQYNKARTFGYSYNALKALFSTVGPESELIYVAGALAAQYEHDHMRYFSAVFGQPVAN